MKYKKSVSFICALMLTLTLVSGFAHATPPEVTGEGNGIALAAYDAEYEVIQTGTYIYNRASTGSGYKCPVVLPVGARVMVNLAYVPPGYFEVSYSCSHCDITHAGGFVQQSRLRRV